jgi:hypothetical protein
MRLISYFDLKYNYLHEVKPQDITQDNEQFFHRRSLHFY